jgi:hypothetical protein
LRLVSTLSWLGASAAIASAWPATSPHFATVTGYRAKRTNELTLARLRPGVDSASRALELLRKPANGASPQASWQWTDACRGLALKIDFDDESRISVIQVGSQGPGVRDCSRQTPRSPWRTGRDLAVLDSADRTIQLYGNPDSRSPSTRNGQRLELLYYAFDWAGAGVPQVLDVLCTLDHDNQPGRVIEITLAASSL